MKKSELRQIIKEEIRSSLNEGIFSSKLSSIPTSPLPSNSDVERILRNFKDEHYLPAMDDIDRNILVGVLERYRWLKKKYRQI